MFGSTSEEVSARFSSIISFLSLFLSFRLIGVTVQAAIIDGFGEQVNDFRQASVRSANNLPDADAKAAFYETELPKHIGISGVEVPFSVIPTIRFCRPPHD